MNRRAVRANETHGHLIGCKIEVDKAIDASGKRAAIITDKRMRMGTASAREHKGRFPAGDFKMLEIVVVAAQVDIDVVLFKERAPILLEGAVISDYAVAE